MFWPGSEPSPHVAKAGNAPAIRSHANLNPTLPSMSHPGWLIVIHILVYYDPHIIP